MIQIVLFLVVGLISGWLATNFVEGSGYGGLGDIVIGIAGAFIGNFLFSLLGVSFRGFWGNVFCSVVGAVALLFIVNFFRDDETVSP